MDTIRMNRGAGGNGAFDWQDLIHPAAAYAHPRDVLADPDLTKFEKRAVLSSWASDACAVKDSPGLRRPPGTHTPVTFDEIIDALRALDDEPNPPKGGGKGARRPFWRPPGEGEGSLPQAA